MAENSYIFGDLLTSKIIEEIRLQSVSFKNQLDTGEFRGTFHLDQSGKDNDVLLAATIPGRCFVVIERDGVVVGDYILWTRTYQSQAKVFQLYGIPWKDYSETRMIDRNYKVKNMDQRQILVDLYALMQSDPNSPLVELPDFRTVSDSGSTKKTLEVFADEKKTFRQVIDSFADADDGFDWMIRTERQSDGNFYRRYLDVAISKIGSVRNDGMPTFTYHDTEQSQGGNILNYWTNDSMADAATHFFGIGAGDGGNMVTATVIHQDLLSNGFPRYDATVDKKDISSKKVLEGITKKQAALLKAPLTQVTLEVNANVDPVFGTYNIGDTCLIEITDPRFPETFTKETRIYGWEYYPPDDENIEYVRLTVEGEEYGA